MMDEGHVLGTINITVYLPADGSELEISAGITGHLDQLTQLGALELARESIHQLNTEGE